MTDPALALRGATQTLKLSCAFRGETLGFLISFLKNADGGCGDTYFIRVGSVAGQLGIDEFHAKQLIFHHFEESLSLFDRKFH